jgi:FtsZ-interacting cell division protein ZipA
MDTWLIVLIIVAVLALVGIIIVGGRQARERQLEGKREEAGALRKEADRHTTEAGQRESFAQEQAEKAEKERTQAEAARERADEVDPDLDT